MENQIKQSQNRVQLVGTLAEINLQEVEKEVTLDPNGKAKKVTCSVIEKKEFKNPSLLIEVSPTDSDGNVRYTSQIGVNFFNTYEKKLDKDGKVVVDNPRFKSLQTILNTYKSMKDCKEGEIPTRVKIDGSLVANEYATEQGEYKSFPQISAFQCSSTGVPDYDISEGEITGIIRKIVKETRGEEATETGRLKVELYIFDNQGKTTPQNLIVEDDLAEVFEETYEVGNSVRLYYDVLTKTVGNAPKANTSAFGRREKNTVSGFEVTEYSIFKGDEPFEEENEYYIPVESMKEAMKAREILIETKINEAKEKKSNTTKGDASKGTSRGGLSGARKPKANHVETEEKAEDLF